VLPEIVEKKVLDDGMKERLHELLKEFVKEVLDAKKAAA
jgi:hypothetical protein